MPPILALWRWQAKRGAEPDDLGKLAIGCLIFAIGTAWLAGASWVAGADGRAPFLWAVAFHLISNVGWLYFVPTTTALYAAKSPAALRGTLLGVNMLSLFAASLLSGRLGGLYEVMTPSQFWLMHAAIVGVGAVLLVLLARPLRRLLADDPPGEVR